MTSGGGSMDAVARTPLILEVKGNSLDDGPGIRTVVFLKGCPLSCSWCHNPESKRTGPELSFEARECVGCGECASACTRGAIDRGADPPLDRSLCDLCFRCVDICPSGALSRVGRYMEPGEVAALIRRDVPFFETSGGGVTLSGGEPAMFPTYCSELLKLLGSMGVHTLLETCGQYDGEVCERDLFPLVDAVYFDLKLADDARHRAHCGTGNARIRENFERLAKLSREGGPELLPRVPLVPGVTDTGKNLRALADFLRLNGQRTVSLLEYNPLWLKKLEKIGDRRGTAVRDGFDRWMSRDEVERCRTVFHDFELV